MGIEFDDAAAVRLLSCATEVALALRAGGAARRADAEDALHDFHGAYARLYEQAHTVESEDRVRLVRALDDLAGQLHVVRRQAHDEQRRQHDLAAWHERERQRDQVLVGVGAPLRPALDWSDAVVDPKPSETPVRPTPLTARFHARTRVRTSSGGSGGRSGADPDRLRRVAARARAQDAATAQELTRVRNAWVTFTRTCAWVPVDDASLVPGFEDHLAENAADAAWLDRIADAFAAAGGGSLSDGVLDAAGASRLPRELQRVLDPSSTTVEVAAAWHALGLSDQDVEALPLRTKLQLAGIDGLPAVARDIASRAVLRAAVANPGRVYRMLGLPYTYGAVGLEEFTRQVLALRDGLERADQSAARLAPPSAQVGQLVGFGTSERRARRGDLARGPRHGVERDGERTGRDDDGRECSGEGTCCTRAPLDGSTSGPEIVVRCRLLVRLPRAVLPRGTRPRASNHRWGEPGFVPRRRRRQSRGKPTALHRRPRAFLRIDDSCGSTSPDTSPDRLIRHVRLGRVHRRDEAGPAQRRPCVRYRG
ncbi:hypothetical protein DEJ15_06525 [Curtobacterium sp. MCJR17_043]|nr:hypothetical protein [Curtobacterium sp. MCJR17_043]WIB36708.1 hypothetical protein DEJ15_06525 [Curtobacterium sp. MCJR17_043]